MFAAQAPHTPGAMRCRTWSTTSRQRSRWFSRRTTSRRHAVSEPQNSRNALQPSETCCNGVAAPSQSTVLLCCYGRAALRWSKQTNQQWTESTESATAAVIPVRCGIPRRFGATGRGHVAWRSDECCVSRSRSYCTLHAAVSCVIGRMDRGEWQSIMLLFDRNANMRNVALSFKDSMVPLPVHSHSRPPIPLLPLHSLPCSRLKTIKRQHARHENVGMSRTS